MRKTWMEPQIEVQQFTSNEYVAACGDTEVKTYNFECNAGNRNNSYNVYFADGTPYASSNDNEEWSAEFTGYHPCGATHSASTDSGFVRGYMYQQDWRGNNTGSPTNVVIWTENGRDVHCTVTLDKELIDILRS